MRKIMHIKTCLQLKKKPCPSNKSLHGEQIKEHWFSGWPGAYCMKCFEEDMNELCLADGCKCPCHDKFWEFYEENYVKK